MRWFGKDWGAPICKDAEHMDVAPLDWPCSHCTELILTTDRGFEIPGVGMGTTYWHLDCFMCSVIPEKVCKRSQCPQTGKVLYER